MVETLPLFESDVVEPEERRPVERQDWSPDAALSHWLQEQPTGEGKGAVRLAKLRNGCRLLQQSRGKSDTNPEYVGGTMLKPSEYYSLAQCVFRDSHLVRELLERYPDGTEDLVDRIRIFVRR